MKNPADCWTAAYPDFPFGNLSLDIQGEEGVRGGQIRH